MAITVLANKGSIGMSIAGVTDKFKLTAGILTMGERLFGDKVSDKIIEDSLKDWEIDPTSENVAKVRGLMQA
ncbi:MAG: hypothetical protein LBJ10_07925 [Clostridiales bacterium]|jgi:hypothetical protein|nr:hypothetical protein [Clostridiales bacterium]